MFFCVNYIADCMILAAVVCKSSMCFIEGGGAIGGGGGSGSSCSEAAAEDDDQDATTDDEDDPSGAEGKVGSTRAPKPFDTLTMVSPRLASEFVTLTQHRTKALNKHRVGLAVTPGSCTNDQRALLRFLGWLHRQGKLAEPTLAILLRFGEYRTRGSAVGRGSCQGWPEVFLCDALHRELSRGSTVGSDSQAQVEGGVSYRAAFGPPSAEHAAGEAAGGI